MNIDFARKAALVTSPNRRRNIKLEKMDYETHLNEFSPFSFDQMEQRLNRVYRSFDIPTSRCMGMSYDSHEGVKVPDNTY